MASTDPSPSAPDTRLAPVHLGVLVTALVLAVAGVLSLVIGVDDDEDTAAAVSVLGPTTGTALGPYATERAGVLDAADGTRVAVISFTDYRRPSEADEFVADRDSDAAVLGALVALPGGEPQFVPDPVDAIVAGRQRAAEEIPALEELLPTVEDPDFVAVYEDELVRLAELVDLDDDAPVVFALVVRADADRLQEVAARPGVRLVDVSDVRATGLTAAPSVRGVRPEETTTAGSPPLRD